MNFAGSEQVIYDFQINMGTGAFNSALTFPDARTSYEKLHDVYPVGVKKFTSGDMPTGLDSNQLYYLKKTGSNYKFYLTLENAVAETSHFVFTDTKDFLLVFTKFRRTLSTFSIAEDVGDMYCCEPPLDLNSTTLYDRCTVVWEGASYTLKRVPNASNAAFLFRSDPFLKNQMWNSLTITAQYKEIQISPIAWVSDYDFMTVLLSVQTMSTYNQLGIAHVIGSTDEYVVGGSTNSSFSVVTVGGGAITYLGNVDTVGYWAVPTITITSTTGTGATVAASVGSNGVLSWTITNGGSGYVSAFATVNFNSARTFELINPSTGTVYWPTSSFPYSGTLTDVDTVRALPTVSYAFSGTSVMPTATAVLKDVYMVQTKATPFPTALELPNCVAVATSTITLSGLQTIGGVPLQAGDRVLVMGNNSNPDFSKSNGIYLASAGSWSRDSDTFVLGSYTFVNQGLGGKRRYRIIGGDFGTVFPVVLGTTKIVFASYTSADLPITYDNVALGNITATCNLDAETNTYYSAVMTLNGIPGRINFGTVGGLPATNRAKFLIGSGATGTGINLNFSNDDFNGLSLLTNYGFETVSDPPGVVVPTVPTRFFTGLTQSAPFFDTRLRADGSFSLTPYRIYRDLGTVKTGSIMSLGFSRVGRAVKGVGLPSEIFYIKADNGDSYITSL